VGVLGGEGQAKTTRSGEGRSAYFFKTVQMVDFSTKENRIKVF
jgi:hypothetical protein